MLNLINAKSEIKIHTFLTQMVIAPTPIRNKKSEISIPHTPLTQNGDTPTPIRNKKSEIIS
jgi:hypothetical protein